jgi:hypothetical protein
MLLPPYWDSIVGLFVQSIWLERHDFNLIGLMQQPSYEAGGPNVRPTNLIAFFIAALYRILEPKQVFFVCHAATLLCGATIWHLFYIQLQRFMTRPEAAAWCSAALVSPIFAGQLASMYLEIPAALFLALSIHYLLKTNILAAVIIGATGVLVKESFFLYGAAIVAYMCLETAALALISTRLIRWKRIAMLSLIPISHVIHTLYCMSFSKSPVSLLRPFTFSKAVSACTSLFPEQALLVIACFVAGSLYLWKLWAGLARQVEEGASNPERTSRGPSSSVRTDSPPSIRREFPRLQVVALLSLFVVASWGFYFSFHNSLCRYLTQTVFPLYCLAGILLSAMLGRTASLCCATVLMVSCVANWSGMLLPTISGPTSRSGHILERSCEFLADQRACIEMCHVVEATCQDQLVIAQWPFVQMLAMPQLGYVNVPPPRLRASVYPLTYASGVLDYFDMERTDISVVIHSPTVFDRVTSLSLGPAESDDVLFKDASRFGNLTAYRISKDQAVKRIFIPHLIISGNLAEMRNESAEAIENYRHVLKFDLRAADVWHRLGYLYIATAPHSAVECLKAAAQLKGSDPTVVMHLALAQLHSGDLAGASESIEYAIKLKPKDPDIQSVFRLIVNRLRRAD